MEKKPKSHFNALAYLENGVILVPIHGIQINSKFRYKYYFPIENPNL